MNSSLDDFCLSLADFEGPLPLLLHLIERNELEITRVSVAAVADQFIALVAGGRPHDLASTGEFLALAARLLLIKSRAIISHGSVEARGEILDDAETLARQIADYVRYQAAARQIAARFEAQCNTCPRIAATPVEAPSNSRPRVRVDAITRSARRLFSADRGREEDIAKWPEVLYATVKDDLLTEVRRLRMTTFADLCRGAWHPLVVITMFLAVLDAVRMEQVAMCQVSALGPIILRPVGGDFMHA